MDEFRINELTIKENLLILAEQGYKKFSSTLNPGVENVLGIRVPQLRALARQIAAGNWQSYLDTADSYYMEERMLQGMVIAYVKNITLEERLHLLREFIPLINSWSVCDSVVSSLKVSREDEETLWLFICQYLTSEEEYKLRFSVVMMLLKFVDDEHIFRLLEIFANIHHDGYYVKMAVAWAVSVCMAKYPEITYEFLGKGQLDDFTHNKSIQKCIESYRVSDAYKQRLRLLKRTLTA